MIRRPQFGLLDALLLFALAGVVSSVLFHRYRAADLQLRIQRLRQLAGEFDALAPASVMQAIEDFTARCDDYAWRVRLPQQEHDYRLLLATRGIGQASQEKPETALSFPVPSGDHQILLSLRWEGGAPVMSVALDGRTVLRRVETPDWKTSSSSTSSQIRSLAKQTADRPLELYRSRLGSGNAPSQFPPQNVPANGVHLWLNAGESPAQTANE